MTGKT